jgi:hypothetical protein
VCDLFYSWSFLFLSRSILSLLLFLFLSILIFNVLQGPHGKFRPPALCTLFTNIIQRRSSSTMTYASVVQTICACLHCACCSNNINQGNSRIFRKLQLSVLLDFLTRLLRTTTPLITFILCMRSVIPMGGLDNTKCVELVSCFGCFRTLFMVIQYLFLTVTLDPWTGLVIIIDLW